MVRKNPGYSRGFFNGDIRHASYVPAEEHRHGERIAALEEKVKYLVTRGELYKALLIQTAVQTTIILTGVSVLFKLLVV